MSVPYHHESAGFRELFSFEERMRNGATLKQGVGTLAGRVVFYVDGFLKESAAIPVGEVESKIEARHAFSPPWCSWQLYIHRRRISDGFEYICYSEEDQDVVCWDGIEYFVFYTCRPPATQNDLLRNIRYAYMVQAAEKT